MTTRAEPPRKTYCALDIVAEIAADLGYARTDLDPYSKLVAQFANGEATFLVEEGIFPINGFTGARLAKDKAHAAAVLSAAGFRVPRGGHFFVVPEWSDIRPPGRELPEAFEFAADLGYPVFVKPIDGSRGRLARAVESPEDLGHHLVEIGRQTYAARIEQLISGVEHRAFVLDGRVRFTYAKHAGAGAANANPNAGGILTDLSTTPPAPVEAWAARVANAMELRVCGIDFFVPAGLDDDPAAFTILEVNASPSLKTIWDLGAEDLVRGIWADVITARIAALTDPPSPA